MGENYKRIKVLGEGSFGKCYLAECTNTGVKYAIKEIDIRQMSAAEKDEALKEAKILERLQHPNIIKFHEVYRTKNGKLCIVMDFADGGDLQDKIKSQRGKLFSEREVLDFFVQLCLAMKHVHDRKILHRDIKSQNVFLSGATRVKLGDFGIARVLRNTCEKARTMVGTPYYLSPEIIENKPYSFKSDVWSLGVMLYELCALKPPFDASSLHFLAMKIVRGQYSPVPPHYSRDLKGLVAQMLTIDPNRRPTINQILRQPFIKERIKQFLSETVANQEFSHTVLHSQNVFNPSAPPSAPPAEIPRREIPPSRDAARPRALPPKEPLRELPRELPKEFQQIEAQRDRDRQEQQRQELQRDVEREAQRIKEIAQKERERIEAQRDRERMDQIRERERLEAQQREKERIERERYEAYRERERQEAIDRERRAKREQEKLKQQAEERDRLEKFKQEQARVKAEAAKNQARYEQQQREAAQRPLTDQPRSEPRRDEPKSGGMAFYLELDSGRKKEKGPKEKFEAERRRREQEEEEKRKKAQDYEEKKKEKVQQREEERQKMLKDIKKKKKSSSKKPAIEWGGNAPSTASESVEEDKAPVPYVKERYQPREAEPRQQEHKPRIEVTKGEGSKKFGETEVYEQDRKRMLAMIRERKKVLQKQKENVFIEVYYPGMKEKQQEEQENEAYALELQEVLLLEGEEEEEVPPEDLSAVEIGEDREDFDPDFERETAPSSNESRSAEPYANIIPTNDPVLRNTQDKLESMRHYLSEQLGEDQLMAFYRSIRENDRPDLDDYPYDKYIEALSGILTEQKIREFAPLIYTLVFLENDFYSSN
mmetsp:Transcript_16227/g.29550  ORF Transcript_16227/g.29550 Transcript_16227/m.29550 type:complete len:827 (+) Transcript_16227:27-2507(+)